MMDLMLLIITLPVDSRYAPTYYICLLTDYFAVTKVQGWTGGVSRYIDQRRWWITRCRNCDRISDGWNEVHPVYKIANHKYAYMCMVYIIALLIGTSYVPQISTYLCMKAILYM